MTGLRSRSQAWMLYLLKKYEQLKPFDASILNIMAKPGSPREPVLKAVQKCRLPEPIANKINELHNEEPERARGILKKFFQDYPYSPLLAEQMLRTELQLDTPAGRGWLDQLKLPPALRPDWNFLLMQARLLQEDYAGARTIYDNAPLYFTGEHRLITAAEALIGTGDKEKGLEFYQRAFALDPAQQAAKYRIAELQNPLKPDRNTLNANIAICLYSYNKSALMQDSLRSLAKSELGRASILVLLNGCTDDSLEAVRALNEQLFDGRIEIISLPVNVGAPAARNWLLAMPACKQADYVAFWDDDVSVQENWLPSMLTVLAQNPEAGAVGAKILSPGKPKKFQYLYRNIALAQPGLVRISLGTPNHNQATPMYDFVRPTANVMGCCHIFTRAACDRVPSFDLRFSPSQMDDICHDIDLGLAGFTIMYCGLVECVHFQMSGIGLNTRLDLAKFGQVQGNDTKFYYRFADKLDQIRRLNNLTDVSDLPLLT